MMHQENLHQDNMMLIQAGVDGELDAAGKAELSALLESSEAAREHHETLIRFHRLTHRIHCTAKSSIPLHCPVQERAH